MKVTKIAYYIKNYLTDSAYRFGINTYLGMYNHMSDSDYLKKAFYYEMGKTLNLNNPKTFNEKLQWLKVYDHNPQYTVMVDKYKAKKYVADIIGEQYIIPTIAVWDKVEDIDWDSLPRQFVLKVTHDSGGLVICKDKSKLDIKSAQKKLRKSLKHDYYLEHREWPYKNVPRKIIAEKYMSNQTVIGMDNEVGELTDYKLMCFGGEVKCTFTVSDRFSGAGMKVTVFDLNWNELPFGRRHCPKSQVPIKKPSNYEKMIELAEKLSEGLPFLRVDFYEVNSQIYFGELTFFPASGFEEFTPEEWDFTLGNWLELPK